MGTVTQIQVDTLKLDTQRVAGDGRQSSSENQVKGAKEAMSTTRSSTSLSTTTLFPNLSTHQQLVKLTGSLSPQRRRPRALSRLVSTAASSSASPQSSGPPLDGAAPAGKQASSSPTTRLSPASPNMAGVVASSSTQLPLPPMTNGPLPRPVPGGPKFAIPQHVALHPEFNGTGDVLIVCTEQSQQIGFLVNGSMMRMASPILSDLLDQCAQTSPKILRLSDSVHDMHAFLRLLRLASPADKAYPPPFNPSISQCAGIHALTQKYNGWYPRAVLDFHVELHASDIVDNLGPDAEKKDVFMLLRLAHALHSSFLWAQVCDRLRTKQWWHEILNPWQFTHADIASLGQSIHSILSILATVSSRERLYSHLDELCVLYSEDGDVSVAAAERSGACCPCASVA